jgi:hypothetical protein
MQLQLGCRTRWQSVEQIFIKEVLGGALIGKTGHTVISRLTRSIDLCNMVIPTRPVECSDALSPREPPLPPDSQKEVSLIYFSELLFLNVILFQIMEPSTAVTSAAVIVLPLIRLLRRLFAKSRASL